MYIFINFENKFRKLINFKTLSLEKKYYFQLLCKFEDYDDIISLFYYLFFEDSKLKKYFKNENGRIKELVEDMNDKTYLCLFLSNVVERENLTVLKMIFETGNLVFFDDDGSEFCMCPEIKLNFPEKELEKRWPLKKIEIYYLLQNVKARAEM